MELFVSIVIILVIFSVYPLRLIVREKQMRKLAQDFGLHFRSGDRPKFFDFYFRIVSGPKRGKRELNHIEGIINGHKVHIYDKFHFFFDSTLSTTVIEINGETQGKKKFSFIDYLLLGNIGVSFFFGLSSAQSLRRILNELRK